MVHPNGALVVALGLSQSIYLVAVLTLGIRLALMAKRTRKVPEALLCVHFLLCCSLGYVLLGIGIPAAYEPGLLAPLTISVLIGVGHLASSVGVWAGVAFNYLVFRSGESWARGLVWLTAIILSIAFTGAGLGDGFSSGKLAGLWAWMLYGTYTVAAAWVMVEPLIHHRVMRRRQRLGLADPLITNRFLLWGSGSVCRFTMLIVGATPTLFFERIPPEIWPTVVSFTLIIVALAGVGVSVNYWLIFFPTRGYVRFINRRNAAVGT